MPGVDFGQFLPDLAGIGAPHLVSAKNCRPAADHYRPLPGLSATTNALDARARGVFPVRDADNAAHMFAGDAEKLYKLVGSTWTDYSRLSGAYTTATTTTRWRFARFGDRVLAANGLDTIQYIDASTAAANFADLPGSPGTAKFVAAYEDFVFLGALGSSGMAIKWSGIGNSEQWTPGVSLSDEQEFADGGNITGLATARGALYVFHEQCVRRVLFVGGAVIMQIDKVLENIGCIEPSSLVQWGQRCFFLAENGWYMWDFESQPIAIGQEKFDRWFRADSDRDYWYLMSTVIDPLNQVFACGYVADGASAPNHILIYNFEIGAAAWAEVSHELLVPALALGVSLDDLLGNLDTDYAISFDDPFYQGGAFYFGAMNSDHKLASFAGANLEATFETNATAIYDGQRSSVPWIKPVADATAATAAAGYKVRPGDAVTFGSQVAQQASGRCPQRGANGFYHAAKVVIPAGEAWTFARGIEFGAPMARGIR